MKHGKSVGGKVLHAAEGMMYNTFFIGVVIQKKTEEMKFVKYIQINSMQIEGNQEMMVEKIATAVTVCRKIFAGTTLHKEQKRSTRSHADQASWWKSNSP